ncbi:cadherin EGF LAG seven-pass G-type receptor 2-like [Saccostrea echinata]|uniref:cadherin EGF LAG seven-pass G-type receptor 2-like n=1 Tax=Saccostrea echinata TaxID=191078 RepID=UPI002A83AACB|nr:cadherin EGF LAG seven-pass G-type receptor 2-like [Saccostrea echinata]
MASRKRGQLCDNNDRDGENNPDDKDDEVDNTAGLGLLLDASDNEYMIKCCGFVDAWEFYAKSNTGVVDLQVWRPIGGGIYTLVGQNSYTVTNTDREIRYSIPVSERIPVKSGDYIGFYTAGNPIVAYKREGGWWNSNGWTSSDSIGSSVVGDTYDWGSATSFHESREYAINVQLDPGNRPSLSNLDNSLSFLDDTAVNTLIYTITATDSDTSDVITTEMTTLSSYFTFDQSTGEVRNTGILPSGTTSLTFRVTDTCGRTDTKTLTIVVTNIPPVIHNLPASCDLSEDHASEQLLYTINATDSSSLDKVTCSVNGISPTTDNFFARLVTGSTTLYGVYVKAQPSLDYDTARQYDVTVRCTDGKDPVTEVFTIYISRNNPPVFVNLQATTRIPAATSTKGNIIYTVNSTDEDSSQLYYNMTCVPASCPFTIHNYGEVIVTSDLSSHTVAGYDLYIYVTDGNTLVGPRTLTVIIEGINSVPTITNLPLLTPITVQENVALSTPVFQVSFTDVDAGQNHTYHLYCNPSLGSTLFSINSTNGLITTSSTQTINYESVSTTSTSFQMTVTVSDGYDTATSSFTVAIADQNEAPVFGKDVYFISGTEGMAGAVVSNPSFDVTDPDSGDTQTYSIDCPSFNINPGTGVVTLSHDYDLDVAGTATSVTCTVTVTDGDLKDTASLVITLNDVNDHTPVMGSPTYTFYASPNTGVGTVIGVITASDGDLGSFGNISYSLDQISLGNEYFGVKTNGDIYVKNSLLGFSTGITLSLTATARDKGGLQDTATITVIIPESTTAAPVTTTDRHLTFWEDTGNIAWVTVASVLLCGFITYCSYLLARYGNFPCVKHTYKRHESKVNTTKWSQHEYNKKRNPANKKTLISERYDLKPWERSNPSYKYDSSRTLHV